MEEPFTRRAALVARSVGHGFDAAELGADTLSTELPGDAVMDEPLAQRNDFNVGGPRLPDLTCGQWPETISVHLHPAIGRWNAWFCSMRHATRPRRAALR